MSKLFKFSVIGLAALLTAATSKNPEALKCKIEGCKNCSLTIEPDLKRAEFMDNESSYPLLFDKIEKEKFIFRAEPTSSTAGYKLLLDSKKLTAELKVLNGKKEKKLHSKIKCKK